MTKVAILATVWLHLVVLGLLVGGTESLRIRKLPMPDIDHVGERLAQVVHAPAPPSADRGWCGVH